MQGSCPISFSMIEIARWNVFTTFTGSASGLLKSFASFGLWEIRWHGGLQHHCVTFCPVSTLMTKVFIPASSRRDRFVCPTPLLGQRCFSSSSDFWLSSCISMFASYFSLFNSVLVSTLFLFLLACRWLSSSACGWHCSSVLLTFQIVDIILMGKKKRNKGEKIGKSA